MVIVVVAALAVTVFGVGRLVAAAGDPGPAVPQATLGGLTAQVNKAGWVDMDHDMSPNAPGYQMPPAMMPGMPTGDDQRLSVTVTVVNTGDTTRPLRAAKEFTLHAGKGGESRTPHSDTFGDLPRLAPHNAVTGTLFFDLPPGDLTDSPIWIEWSHDGAAAGLTIPLDGALPPTHTHNP